MAAADEALLLGKTDHGLVAGPEVVPEWDEVTLAPAGVEIAPVTEVEEDKAA